MPESLEVLRRAIIDTVCVKNNGQERMVPESSSWIMDFRRVCLDPQFLDAYTEVFYERFRDELPFQVGGMEVAAIPLVSAIVMKMRERGVPINGFFVRKSRKKSGLLKMVEGKMTDDPIIFVDDLINHGYTSDRLIRVAEEGGKVVKALFPIFRFRELSAYRKYLDRNIRVESIFALDDFKDTLGTTLMREDIKKPLAKESFTVAWRFRSPDPKLEHVIPKSAPVIDDERVYFGSDRGIMWALHQADGSVAWERQIGLRGKGKEIFSTPLLHNGRLYFGAYDGNIYCLDAATGKRVWVSFEADWVEGSPAMMPERDMLLVPVLFGAWKRKGGLLALDSKTGREAWRRETPSAIQGTPLYIRSLRSVIVGSEDGTLFSLDSETGAVRFTFVTGGAIKEAVAYDEKRSLIFCNSFDGTLYALSATNGLLHWKYDIGQANYAAPLVHGDKIYVASLDKVVYCFDIETGKKVWEFPVRARAFASPRLYNGRLYVGANDARFYELDPVTGKQTGFFQAVERITSPVAYNARTKRFFLPTYANELYCLTRNRVKATD